MRDPFRWSISLGRWGIPTVRLHVFFLVFAAATYFLCAQDHSDLMGKATAAMTVLLLSVLAHEWSHWLVAYRHGAAPKELVVGPLGGVSQWPRTADTRGTLACMLAGPGANLMIALTCAMILRATAVPFDWLELINPLRPAWAVQSSLAQQILQLTLWINWLLFLVNLLPAFPFDGGHILRGILNIVCPKWKRKRVAETVFWIAVFLSAIIMAAALALWKYDGDTVLPTSFAILLLAVVLLVSARRDMDYSIGMLVNGVYDTELEDPWPEDNAAHELATEYVDENLDEDDSSDDLGDVNPWLGEPDLEDRGLAPEEIEAEEERQVDSILSRLHNEGLASLTTDERALLQRVSERYRNRLGRREPPRARLVAARLPIRRRWWGAPERRQQE